MHKEQKKHTKMCVFLFGTPKGIRTPVAAVRGQCPRPLDHGGKKMAAEQGFEP